MSAKIKDIKRGWDELKANILGVQKGSTGRFAGLEVGVFGDIDPEAPLRAIWNEYGVGERPSRPFLATSFDEVRGKAYRAFALGAGKRMLRKGAIDAGLSAAGRVFGERIKLRITTWKEPPNRGGALRRKRGVSNPLIETGEMRRSVGYRVRGGPIKRDF